MKKVAILASENMMPGHPNERSDFFERDEQMAKLIPAFKAHGMELDLIACLLYTSPSPRDQRGSRMPSSA